MTNANDPIAMLHNASEKDIVMTGLTKREYFAAMAMQGLIGTTKSTGSAEMLSKAVAIASIMAADALIQELNKQQS